MGAGSNRKPFISVCIPSYNYARFLAICIESVLKQNYKDFEVIVVDDASTDSSIRVARSFRDSRVHVYCNPRNIGMISNWNECVRRASGKYIKMLMADDMLLPECLDIYAAVAKAFPEAGCISCLARYINESCCYLWDDPCLYKEQVLFLPSSIALIGKSCGAVFSRTPTHTLVRRDLIVNLRGYDKSFSLAADTHMHVRLMSLAPLILIGRPLVYFRRHRSAASSKNYVLFAEMYRRIFTMMAELAPVKNTASVKGYAIGHANHFAVVQGLKALRKGKIYDVFKILGTVPPQAWLYLFRHLFLKKKRISLLRHASVKRFSIAQLK
jgi:glycosyltransferase involved in cell wall biosynthesis